MKPTKPNGSEGPPPPDSGAQKRVATHGDNRGGYREVLGIAGPLIISTASMTVTLFVDRMFLSWYSLAAVAASLPAGITYFTVCSLFMGTAQYVNSIVAQLHGAGDKPGCSRATWQGLFFALASAPIILAFIYPARYIFDWSAHGPQIVELEKDYFSILMLGGVMVPINAALSGFFSGRGRTWIVMWGNILGNAANVALDYALIFGHWGFPEMGMNGAAIGTAVTGVIPALYWGREMLSRKYQSEYRTRAEFRWDPRLLFLLVRFGIPSGMQLFLDVGSFSLFILLVGRLGEVDLAVSNIVLSIEMLSFLPMVGMSIATAILVGNYIGAKEIGVAEKSAYSALKLSLGYMAFMATLFVACPKLFLGLFRPASESPAAFSEIVTKGVVVLRMVAAYTLMDTLFIVFSGALRGAGDTRFAMWAQVILAWVMFVPPVYIIIEILGWGLFAAWGWGVVYVTVLGLVFLLRFRSGKWKDIEMIRRA